MSSTVSNKKAILLKHEIGFETNFIEDLESWYSADIACCDNCKDDFLNHWPLANEMNDFEFQRSGIDLDCFYSGSKSLQFIYTKEEYDVLKSTIECPRCNSPLQHNIWAYNLPFYGDINVIDFEENIQRLTELTQTTPFFITKRQLCIRGT